MADLGRAAAARRPLAPLLALVATLLAVVLGAVPACSALPDSGAAGPGTVIDNPDPEPLRVAPVGPRPLAGPAEVVAGFLKAGAATDDDHVVARSFLTARAAGDWRPSGDVVVYPDDPDLVVRESRRGATARVEVAAPLTARIDATGRYVEAAPGAGARAGFTLERQGGTWRISALDEAFGSWLPRYALDRSFSALPVTFVAAGTTTLVPDLRWLPGPGPGLATALVRQLLQGPPDYLRAAVRTGFPTDTTLAVDAVPTTGGVARVDLTARALEASPEMRQMMWAQLTSTLRRLPAVVSVELTVAGTPFDVPGVSDTSVYAETAYRDDVRVGGAAMVLSGDRLLRVQPGTGKLAAEGLTLPGGGDVGSVAVGPDASPVVGVDRSGRRLLRLLPRGSAPLLTGRSLVAPVVDADGAVWTADSAVPGRVRVLAPAQVAAGRGDAATLQPSWLTGRTVVALDVSRDGARLAVVSADPAGRRRLDVAAVQRQAQVPVALGSPLQVGQALTDLRDVAWAQSGTLVALGRGVGSRGVQAAEVLVGGPTSALPPVTSPVSIAAGDGVRALYVVTTAGTVLSRSGSGWAPVGAGRSVSVPQ